MALKRLGLRYKVQKGFGRTCEVDSEQITFAVLKQKFFGIPQSKFHVAICQSLAAHFSMIKNRPSSMWSHLVIMDLGDCGEEKEDKESRRR